ncbi:S-adenosyl-L-methionine-dependent methyltransferase [Pyrenochaeta sp. DS3sAY3a]|nr:S-adenosyl-L-methionine-dependent methyltransferase [Pyrenochaeta sp. DS3sAY3a]
MTAREIHENDIGALSDWFESRPINKKSRQSLAAVILSNLDFVGMDWARSRDGSSPGNDIKMLDYACGPGFLSEIFGPYVSSICAIDASPIMIEKYNAKQSNFGIDPTKVRAVQADWLSSPFESTSCYPDEFHDFDLVTVGAALHHFPDAQEAIRLLAARLKPGGVLYIQDRAAQKGNVMISNKSRSKRTMQGFEKESLGEFMSRAGLVDFSWFIVPQEFNVELPSEEVTSISCFLARAMKPLA